MVIQIHGNEIAFSLVFRGFTHGFVEDTQAFEGTSYHLERFGPNQTVTDRISIRTLPLEFHHGLTSVDFNICGPCRPARDIVVVVAPKQSTVERAL